MTKILSFFLMSLWFLFSGVAMLHADMTDCKITVGGTQSAADFLASCAKSTGGLAVTAGDGRTGVTKQIVAIAERAISFGSLLAVGALVWAGIQYTKSYGEDEKLKKAKTTGIYALIGLILLLISFGIVNIYINFIYTVSGN